MIVKSKDQIMQEMDASAAIAEKELSKVSNAAIAVVGAWLKKHYIKAGYKRLAKLLIAKVK